MNPILLLQPLMGIKHQFLLGLVLLLTAPRLLYAQPQCFNRSDYGVGNEFNNITSVALGDVDGNGKLDIVTANATRDNVTVLLAETGGGYARTDYGVGDAPFSVALGDVNGDGKLDIVTANAGSSNVTVLLAETGGGYARTDHGVGNSPFSVALGDVNGDGKLDIVTANAGGSTVTVLLAETGGGYARTDYGAGNSPWSVALGDVNGDGKLDIVTANIAGDNVTVLLAKPGAESGYDRTDYEVGDEPRSVALGDVNGDGKLDIVTANARNFNVAVLLAKPGAESGYDRTGYGVGNPPFSMALGDVNGDGKLDIVTTIPTGANVAVLLAKPGAGIGYDQTDYGVGNSPASVALGDVNGDGKLDIVTANATRGNNVTVLLNSPPVGITRQPATSSTVCAGATVTASVSVSGTVTAYQWYQNGSVVSGQTAATLSLPNTTTTNTGSYQVVVTSSCNSVTSTTFNLTVTPLPSVSLTNDGPITCARPVVALTATTTSTGGTYRFTGPGANESTTSNQIFVTTTGSYSVVYTNQQGCTARTTNFVDRDVSRPDLRVSNDGPLTCTKTSVTLSSTATEGVTYQWSGPGGFASTASSVTTATAGTYALTVISSNGCDRTMTTTVTSDTTTPTLSLSPASATLTCVSPTASLSATGMGSLRWSTGETSSPIAVTTAGTYSVTLTGTNGCTATATTTISSNTAPPALSLSPASATLTCASPTASLLASGTGTFQWSTGQTTAAISVTSAGTYLVTLTGTNGCTATAITTISSNTAPPVPTLAATPSTVLTGGLATTLTATATNTSGVTFAFAGPGLLTQNPTAGTATANQPGAYSVTVTNSVGCSALTTITLTPPQPLFTTCGSPTTTIGQPLQLLAPDYDCVTGIIRFRTIGGDGSPITYAAIGIASGTNSCTARIDAELAQDIRDQRPNIQPFTLTVTQNGQRITLSWDALRACAGQSPPLNRAPIAPIIAGQSLTTGQFVNLTLPAFTDPDGDALTYTASGLPANGLSFTPVNRSISGTPVTTAVLALTITATDPAGLSATVSFSLSLVAPPNPTLNQAPRPAPVANQSATVGQALVLALPAFTDPNGDVLTYSLTGLPANGLSFDAPNRLITGTPPATGILSLTLTATDPAGLSATTTFTITVIAPPAGGSTALILIQPLYNCQTGAFTFRTTGGNGSPVEYRAIGITGWSTTPGPYTVLPAPDAGPFSLQARQNGTDVSLTFDWKAFCATPNPPAQNQPPVASVVANQTATLGQFVSLTIPRFSDPNADVLTYVLTQVPPSGLSFNLSTLTLSGSPSQTGLVGITVVATDPGGLTASTSFTLTVIAPPASSSVAFALIQPLYNCQTGAFTFQSIGGNGSLIEYRAIGITGWTTLAGPYTVLPFADAGPFTLQARQSGREVSLVWNQKAVCANQGGRQAAGGEPASHEPAGGWRARVAGNPATDGVARVVLEEATPGDRFSLRLLDAQGRLVSQQSVVIDAEPLLVAVGLDSGPGLYLIQVSDGLRQQNLRVIKP